MPRITNHLKPLQALATPGPTAALLLLARIRWTAMTSDKVPQRAKLPPPPQCHPQRPRAALWNILRSPVWAHGRDLGLGRSLLTSQHWLFQPCSPLTAALPCPPGHKPGQHGEPPEKSGTPLFCCNFGQTCSHAHKGAAGQHRAGDSPGQGAQPPSTKLALSTAAGGTRRSSRSHAHSLPSFCLYTQ